MLFAPAVAFFLTHRPAALQKKDHELVLHGYETGRIVRLPGGEFIEVAKRMDVYERWRLVDAQDHDSLRCGRT